MGSIEVLPIRSSAQGLVGSMADIAQSQRSSSLPQQPDRPWADVELEAEFRGQADSALEAMFLACNKVVNHAGFSFGLRDRGAALAAERAEKVRAELHRRRAEEELEAQFKGKPDSVLKQWLQSCEKVVQAASLHNQDVGAPAAEQARRLRTELKRRRARAWMDLVRLEEPGVAGSAWIPLHLVLNLSDARRQA